MSGRNKDGKGSFFNTVFVNPSRRDLIKQLVTMGSISAGEWLLPSFLYAAESKKSPDSLLIKATRKNDAAYEEIRRSLLWNVNTPARYPDLIVQASSEQEIRDALRFAVNNDLRVVCRSSGHNTAGAILRNGGMLLDISPMMDVSVDAERMAAFVQPGAMMYYFYQHIANYGFFFPVAECHGVAIGGYLLGGRL